MERDERLLERLAYIFLLGLMTYGWWKAVGWVKRKIDETEARR